MLACGDAAIDLFLDAVEADKDRQHPPCATALSTLNCPAGTRSTVAAG